MANITSLQIGSNTLRVGNSVLIESYTDPETHQWYRVYSDGWCEQGGYSRATTGGSSVVMAQVNFLKPYIDTNYTVVGSKDTADGSNVGLNCPIVKDQSYFTWSVSYEHLTLDRILHWIAKGYIDLEEESNE